MNREIKVLRSLPTVVGAGVAGYILFVPHISAGPFYFAGIDFFLRGFSGLFQVLLAGVAVALLTMVNLFAFVTENTQYMYIPAVAYAITVGLYILSLIGFVATQQYYVIDHGYLAVPLLVFQIIALVSFTE